MASKIRRRGGASSRGVDGVARRRLADERAIRRLVPRFEGLEPRSLLAMLPLPSPLAGAASALATVQGPGESPPPPPPSDEGDPATQPQSVSGAFLTGGAEVAPGEPKSMTFDKVDQQYGDTCAFDSVLSGVALSNFNLASGITVASQKSATDIIYDVRLYKPTIGGFQQVEIPVEFNGTFTPFDVRSSDPNEFWPTLYQRAYLGLEASLGVDYHNGVTAFGALTGLGATTAPLTAAITANSLAASLNAGTPLLAGTPTVASPYTYDPAQGIIGDHSYTVLGVEIPASGLLSATYVTLRNPWGIDSTSAYEQAVDGVDDGIIRMPWTTFLTYFNTVTTSRLAGPSIDSPQSTLVAPPKFRNPDPGTIQDYEGQPVGPLDLSAVGVAGSQFNYFFKQANVGTLSGNGQFSWTPGPNDVGVHVLTVVARTNPLYSASETFTVDVLPNLPTVGSVAASPTTISAAGTDKLTIQASNVAVPSGTVQLVDFYLDKTSLGGVGPAHSDLGYGTAANNWTWSGYVGGLDPGTYQISAVPVSVANLYPYRGAPATTTLTVTPSIDYEPLVEAFTNAIQASPASSVDETGLGTTVDAVGNTRVFWNQLATPQAQFVREYDAFGSPLTGPVQLSTSVSPTDKVSFVGLPDGSFDEVYTSGGNIDVQRYNASAVAVGGPVVAASNVATPPFSNPTPIAAADGAGDLLIAYTSGTSTAAVDVYALTLSASGTVTRAPWVVNSHTSGAQRLPSVALDAAGVGVIAWQDDDQDAIEARRVSAAGLANGASDFTVYHDPNTHAAGVSAGVDAQGDFTIAYIAYSGIHMSRYGGDGVTNSGDQVVYTQVNDYVSIPKISVNAEGWAFVIWDDGNYGPDGQETLAKLIDPEGQVQSSYFQVPYLLLPDTLDGVSMNAKGEISVEFQEIGANDPNDLVTNFRLYRADMEPVFSGPFNFTVPLGSPVGTVVGQVSATSPSGNVLNYLLENPGAFAVDLATGVVTVADASALKSTAVASYDLTVQATDGNMMANFEPTTNVVVAVVDNTPPVITPIPGLTIDEGEPIAPLIQATDPVGEALTYSAAIAGGGSQATLRLFGNELSLIPAAGYTGTFQVVVTATNGLASSTTSFGVTVVAPTLAPIANATVGSAPSTVALAGADASGAALTYLASIAGTGPLPVSLAVVNNTLVITPAAGYFGTFAVTVAASDGPNAASRTFQVTVTPSSSLMPLTFATAPFGSHNPNLPTAEVEGLYQTILGRVADPGGLALFVGELKSGTSLAQVATTLIDSAEYDADVVVQDYEDDLGRAPSAAEVNSFVAQMQRGLGIEQLAAIFLSSAEYSSLHASNASFLQSLYQQVLGRSPSSTELASFEGQMANGLTRAAIVSIFLGSTESDDLLLDGFYGVFLARPADPSGLAYWVGVLQAGTDPRGVAVALASSAEFVQRAQATVG